MSLRTEIGQAIVKAFNEDIRHGEDEAPDFDPDTCYRAADEVVALLMSRLTGQHFTAEFHPTIIGPAKYVSDGMIYN